MNSLIVISDLSACAMQVNEDGEKSGAGHLSAHLETHEPGDPPGGSKTGGCDQWTHGLFNEHKRAHSSKHG
jgi:hypothetical protein